jgi:DNA-binding NtrC family response regulator
MNKERKQKRILIVDDDATFVWILQKRLAKEGFSVRSVLDPIRAFDLLSDQNPDVILLDVKMPLMTGLEFLKRIRAMGIKTRVICMSAHANMEDARKAIGLDADDYLAKPFSFGKLIELLRPTLEERAVE